MELQDIVVTVTNEDDVTLPASEEVRSKPKAARKDKVSTVDDLKQEIDMVNLSRCPLTKVWFLLKVFLQESVPIMGHRQHLL